MGTDDQSIEAEGEMHPVAVPGKIDKAQLGRVSRLRSIAVAAACSVVVGLTGCRTIEIGAPVAIPIPQNLTEAEAQSLVTDFVEGKLSPTRAFGRVSKMRLGRWQIESWEPGSMVAVYSWRSHILRVNIAFENRTTVLEIGESARLNQSETRIHKRAKALEMELAENIRIAYGKIAMRQKSPDGVASRRSGAQKTSFCSSMWKGDPQEQASCQRAQGRSYDRLRPMISQLEADPTTNESRVLKACYARAQKWAGTDWEAIERCFYSAPASVR